MQNKLKIFLSGCALLTFAALYFDSSIGEQKTISADINKDGRPDYMTQYIVKSNMREEFFISSDKEYNHFIFGLNDNLEQTKIRKTLELRFNIH